MGESSLDPMYGRKFARNYMGENSPDKNMSETSPDKIYEREFVRYNMWARVRQIKCGREFGRKNIWARVRQIKYMGESLPDKIYARLFAS